MTKGIIAALILIAAVIGAVTLKATAPALATTPPETVAPTVRVTHVKAEGVPMMVESQGTVAPRTESELVPEVSGRIVWVSQSLVPGGLFKTGDPLLRMDEADLTAALDRSKATLARAQAEYEHNAYEYQRLRQLEERRLASRSQIENALRIARISEASLQDAKVQVEQAERDLSRATLRAPFDGLVRSERVDLGQYINRGNAIATIYASDAVEVRLSIADDQLAYLNIPLGHRGQLDPATAPDVEIEAEYGGQLMSWRGKIVRTEAEIDAKTRLVNVVAQINAGTDAPIPSVGLFVRAQIHGRIANDVVVLPRTALRNGNQVLIVDQENRLRYRNVELLRLFQDQVIIHKGLESGERICISPIQTVVEGMLVKPITDTDQTTA